MGLLLSSTPRLKLKKQLGTLTALVRIKWVISGCLVRVIMIIKDITIIAVGIRTTTRNRVLEDLNYAYLL